LVNPSGGIEDVSEYGHLVKWIALNVRDFSIRDWESKSVISRAQSAGLKVIPWARLAHPPYENYLHARIYVKIMVEAARRWGSDWIIPNFENEAETTCPPWRAKEAIELSGWKGKVGWSTQGWLPGSSGGGQEGADYRPINQDPVLLQIFPEDLKLAPSEIESKQAGCILHARIDKGFTYVGVTYQTYRALPDWYNLSGTHSVFTGDAIVGQWAKWFPV